MNGQTALPPVVDGFSLNLQWPNCSRWAGFALHQLDALRRSTQYRLHVFVAPEEASTVVTKYATFQTQLRVPPGSWLWAVSFGSFAGCFRISEQGTGQLIYSNFYVPSAAFPHGMQVLLTEPRVIVAPGILSVEIAIPPASVAAGVDFSSPCQIALWCAVPKEARLYQFTECPQSESIRGTEAGGYLK